MRSRFWMLAATLLVGASGARAVEPAPTVVRGDWESGNASQWMWHHLKSADRLQIVKNPVRQGQFAARFEVRPGDNQVMGSGLGERCEVAWDQARSDGFDGRESWWAWSTMFPVGFRAPKGDWNYFTQWHHTGTHGQASIAFIARDGREVCLVVNSGEPDHPRQVTFSLGPLRPSEWDDWMFHVRWSSDDQIGFVEVWRGKERIVPQTFLATLYPGQGVYVKQGLYRAAFDQIAVVYHDGLRMSSSRAGVETATPR